MIDLWKLLRHYVSYDNMICSIHQPNYLPYIGLFHKMSLSDIFVFYDTAQYTKGDYHNRNTIKWPNGPILLSLPVSVKLGDSIRDVRFDPRILPKHWKTIEQAYKKSPYFEKYVPELAPFFASEQSSLSEWNMSFIRCMAWLFGIKTRFIILSELPEIHTKSTDALIEISRAAWADHYLSWRDGRSYLEVHKFIEAHIQVSFQDFHHPKYSQLWWDFLPYMSAIDLLFNEWENSLEFIKPSGGMLSE
jgi:hypothetical protein